ncbi:MAG: sensor domain-containing diguanylate cyclase [Sphaerochaetaceae bacterium]
MESHDMHKLYENLLKSIADPFFIISDEGTYLDTFGGTERSLYDDAHLLKGRNIHDFMAPDFADFFMSQVKRALDGSLLNVFEYQLETETVEGIPKNGPGGIQWFEARLYPLPDLYHGKRAVTALILNISERKHMQQRLRDLSYQDALTRVANRRYFFERLSEQLDLFMQDKSPLSVMILDIDHFKRINDTYGHFAGDQVMKELVDVVRRMIPKDAVLARFGGDEFIVSAEGLPLHEMTALAERLREQIHKHLFSFGDMSIPVTISIGVSTVTVFDTDTESIVSRADKALYQAKELGRNRVVRN